jgi:hypothetical protein
LAIIGHKAELRLRPALGGDRDVAPLLGEAGEVARNIVAAHHVEHDIDTPAAGDALHFLDEILGAVVDRVIGADLQGTGAFRSRPAVTMTVRPNSLPSMIAVVPIPLVPPWTRTVSPSRA